MTNWPIPHPPKAWSPGGPALAVPLSPRDQQQMTWERYLDLLQSRLQWMENESLASGLDDPVDLYRRKWEDLTGDVPQSLGKSLSSHVQTTEFQQMLRLSSRDFPMQISPNPSEIAAIKELWDPEDYLMSLVPARRE
jgi:hypothetical protein